jgi:hypothetical protein
MLWLMLIVVLCAIAVIVLVFLIPNNEPNDYLRHGENGIIQDCYMGTMMVGKVPMAHEYCHEVKFND